MSLKHRNCPACNRVTTFVYRHGDKITCLGCFHGWTVDDRLIPKSMLADPAPAQAPESGGIKYDDSKPMVALIPPHAIDEEAKVWTFGMKKYEAFNWTKGFKYTRVLSAMLRHTLAIMRGEDRDPESGCLHAAHVRCCAAMLIEFTVQGRTELDDRIYSGGNK